MRILYVKPNESERKIVQEVLADHEIIFTDTFEGVERPETIDVICVFVDTGVTRATMEAFPKLSFIVTRSTGFDHIDIKAAKERNITVAHVPRYGSNTVAEYAFGLMFALSRNAVVSYLDMQKKTVVNSLEQYEGFDLAGKTLGVVGTGAIGRHVCEIAKGLHMRVLAYDPYPAQDLVDAELATYCDLPTLMSESDIVTLHVPAMPTTYHMINGEMLSLMKPTAYLINTARGEIVDTQALVQALTEKKLAGAALDVLEGERDLHDEVALLGTEQGTIDTWKTLIADHALIDMPNVIVTPHIAFNTREAKREILDITLKNIQSFAQGEEINRIPE
jgi:D-lactate dehydrogenase